MPCSLSFSSQYLGLDATAENVLSDKTSNILPDLRTCEVMLCSRVFQPLVQPGIVREIEIILEGKSKVFFSSIQYWKVFTENPFCSVEVTGGDALKCLWMEFHAIFNLTYSLLCNIFRVFWLKMLLFKILACTSFKRSKVAFAMYLVVKNSREFQVFCF